MNQTFSSARFGRLLRKFWYDNQTFTLTAMGALLAILITAGLLTIYTKPPESVTDTRPVFVLIMLLVLWPLFTVQVVSVYNDRESAQGALMLPASVFEKWLVLWLVTGAGFLVWFLICFTLLDAVGVYVVNHRQWPPETLQWIKDHHQPLKVNSLDYVDLMRTPIWGVWLVLHPFSLAASLLFRRYTLVIGVFVGLLLFGGGWFLNRWMVSVWLGHEHLYNVVPFSGVGVDHKLGSRYLAPHQSISNVIRSVVGIASVGFLYAVAYFRLKEREV